MKEDTGRVCEPEKKKKTQKYIKITIVIQNTEILYKNWLMWHQNNSGSGVKLRQKWETQKCWVSRAY